MRLAQAEAPRVAGTAGKQAWPFGGSSLNFAAYSTHVQGALQERGFAVLTPPDDMLTRLPVTLERSEPFGRLVLAIAAPEESMDGPLREALVSATAAWSRDLQRQGGGRIWVILVFPFGKSVDDMTSTGIKALRQEGEEWGVIPWVADLEVELIDRHTGAPRIDDQIARVLTEVPRGAVEAVMRKATAPKIGRRGQLLGDLGYVPATRLILAGTIAYFLWSVLMGGGLGFNLIGSLLGGPGSETLRTWGANRGDLVINQGQHWRLFTHMLLHGGLLHLGFNMWALWHVGRHVELIYSTRNMAFIYVVAGVAGGIASTVFRPYAVLSVGASGAVLGLMGALVYFAVALPGRQVDWRSLLMPVGVNLMYGFFIPFIDNYAHIGGFLGGFLAAFIAGIPGQRAPWRTWAMIGTAAVVVLILSGLVPLPWMPLFG